MKINTCFTRPMFEVIVPKIYTAFCDKPLAQYAKEQMQLIEKCGRTCYLSNDKITENSHVAFLRGLVKAGHFSVLEHEKLTVKVTCSRACSHQIVRHRIGSYSQESQRFVNYTKKDEILFIDENQGSDFKDFLELTAMKYFALVGDGSKAEEARGILPNATATRICITYNFRQWRAFFLQRCDKHAQKEIRQLAKGLLKVMSENYPVLFEDLASTFLERDCSHYTNEYGLTFSV